MDLILAGILMCQMIQGHSVNEDCQKVMIECLRDHLGNPMSEIDKNQKVQICGENIKKSNRSPADQTSTANKISKTVGQQDL